jgi:CBS domain-containing protein
MKAQDIMTRQVITFAPDAPIREIVRAFREKGISGAPVVENGEVIGVVTELDLIARHSEPHSPTYLPLLGAQIPLGSQHDYREIVRRIMGLTARDIMTTPVQSVEPDIDVEEVATLMVERHVNPVPVIHNRRLVGIIGHTDLIVHLEEATETTEG